MARAQVGLREKNVRLVAVEDLVQVIRTALDENRFARQTVNDPDLVVPHPEIAHRDFWRRELAELAHLALERDG